MEKNRTAIITGAGSGLGYELALAHVKVGFLVFALDVAVSSRLSELVEELNGRIFAYTCDISSTESVTGAMDDIKTKTSHIDRLFNNAGIHRFADWVTIEETDLDFCKTMIDINAVGPLRVVKAAIPLLRDGSIIINTSSEAGSITDADGIIGYGYAMSKAAMNMGARIMDNWLIGRGIRTLMIHPGRMRTAMRGSHSNIDPWETAAGLMNLIEGIGDIPKEKKFMDYKGAPYNW